jgi:hypothetical protein
MSDDSSVSEAAFELHSSRRGVSRKSAESTGLSGAYLQNGRSDWQSSPPAEKVRGIYRCKPAKSRLAAAKNAVEADNSQIRLAPG